jgi:ATP-dependent helicase STH1/SNF2
MDSQPNGTGGTVTEAQIRAVLRALEELDVRGISEEDPKRQLLLRVVRAYQIQHGAASSDYLPVEESEIPSANSKNAQILKAQISAFSHLVHGSSVPGPLLSFISSNSHSSNATSSSDTVKTSTAPGPKESIVNEKARLRRKALESLLPTLSSHPKLLAQAQYELKCLKLVGIQHRVRTEIRHEMDRMLRLQSASDIDLAFQHTLQHPLLPESTKACQKVEQSKRKEATWILAGPAHSRWITSVLIHSREFFEVRDKIAAQKRKLFKRLQKWNADRERRESQMKEKLERDRLAALKRNDEVAYMALLEQTKNKRLLHLMQQTDLYLEQIGEKVQETHRIAEAKIRAQSGTSDTPTETSKDLESDKPPVATGGIEKKPYYSQIHRIQEKVEHQPATLIGGELKEYQMDGLTWLVSLFNNRLNGILADEMGLGKTVQTIALLCHLYETKKSTGPFIVVVPLSTLSNWALEFQKWAPALYERLVVYKGTPPARKRIWQTQLSGSSAKEWSVVLTTFDYVIKDRLPLARIKWAYVIVDEGHRMKNHNCKLSTTLSQHYDSQFRLILTGTPLQNSLPELWSLLNFLLPSIFHSVENFEKWFNAPFANTGEEVKMNEEESLLVIQRLHKVLRPFLLRRLKTQVEAQLPEKVERIIKVEMSSWQRHMYQQAKGGLVATQSVDGSVGSRGVLNSLMQLRKICDHPYMMRPSLEDVEYDDLLWRTSGKMELLDRILPKLKACGHRVLMFSQFTTALDVLEMYFRYRDIKYLRLDGSTKAEERGELLAQFNAPDSPYFMFILSTRAGGLGLNLQTADTVILFDSDWNPQADLQAQDRAHRIGQKNDVLVLRLATQNSVEEKILGAANYKLDLDSKIIQAGMFNMNSTANDRRTFLLNLLKEGSEEEDEMADVPDPKQVNAIIARSDQEYKIFQQMDRDSAEAELQAWRQTHPTGNPPPRLVTEDELPAYLKVDLQALRQEREMPTSRRRTTSGRNPSVARELTDEEFIQMVQDEEEGYFDRATIEHAMQIDDIDAILEGGDDFDEDGEFEATMAAPSASLNVMNFKKRKAEAPTARTRTTRLQDDMLEIWRAMVSMKDQRGYSIATPFLDLPTEDIAPGYFDVIQSPICFNHIKNKIQTSQYPAMIDFYYDVLQLFRNAHIYNLETSQICIDADLLKASFQAKYDEVTAIRAAQDATDALLHGNPEISSASDTISAWQMNGIEPTEPQNTAIGQKTQTEPRIVKFSFKRAPAAPADAPAPSATSTSPQQRPKLISKPILMKMPITLADSSDDEDDGFADSELRGTGGSFEVKNLEGNASHLQL